LSRKLVGHERTGRKKEKGKLHEKKQVDKKKNAKKIAREKKTTISKREESRSRMREKGVLKKRVPGTRENTTWTKGLEKRKELDETQKKTEGNQ